MLFASGMLSFIFSKRKFFSNKHSMALSNKLAPFSEGAEPPVVTASEESEVQKTLVKHWGFFWSNVNAP